jgi:peptidyl-prolyl cis-trans isomerase SurA
MRWIAVAALAVLFAGPAVAERVDGIAAIVGDEVILRSEVERAAAPVLARIQFQHGALPPEVHRQVRTQALQSLIDAELIEDAATRLGFEASEQDVDRAVEAIARDAGVTVEQIYLAAREQGLDQAQYRSQLAAEITRMKVIGTAVRSRVSVSEDEVAELFEKRYREGKSGVQSRVRHILLPWPPEASDEERAELRLQAESIRERALERQDFGALARTYSKAPSALDGGLTVFREGEVASEMAPYVFGMGPGEISPPVQTRHGVNLVQIVERFDPAEIRLEDMHDRLYAELLEKKTQQEMGPWLEELRKNRYVEVIAPDLR